MMQLNSFFRNTIFLIILPLISFGEKIKIPNILFSEIEISKQEFNDSKYNSQSFSCLMPLKIITYEIEKFYSELAKHYTTEEIVELGVYIGFNVGYHRFFGTLDFYPMFTPDGKLVDQKTSRKIYGDTPVSHLKGTSEQEKFSTAAE